MTEYIEYREGMKWAVKNADVSDSHEHFNDCGYVLTENDLIVDIDNLPKEVIQKMITIFNIKTQIVWTDRGAHLYFKKPDGFKGTKKVTPLGFEVEYKYIKNTKSITIKRNGVLRKIENEGVREDIPAILHSNKRLVSLLGLDEGDGRNQKLFEHRMKIQYIACWKTIVRFINDHIFANPLEQEELDVLCRDVKINAEKDGEGAVADLVMSKYKFIKYLDNIYFYQDDKYVSNIDKMRRLIFNEVGSNQKTRYVDEVIKHIEYRCPTVDEDKTFDIKLENGILRDGKFIEIDSTDFTPYTINIPYNPEAEVNEHVDRYLNHLTNKNQSYKNYLMEMMAHCLVVDKEFKRLIGKFFIFIGDGGNGKGTFLAIIRAILGSKNVSALSMTDMKDERYLCTLQGKLANLGDDVEDAPIDNEILKALKNLSTCDYISIREMRKNSRDVELTPTLIFTSNHILKSFEKGESFKRRIVWLPSYTKVEKKDPKFISNITSPEALEYWMKLIVEGYIRLYENSGFTHCQQLVDFNNQYHVENNSVLEYLEGCTADLFLNRRSPECYEIYKTWAEENGFNVQSSKMFKKSLYDVFGLDLKMKKINGKAGRFFIQV